MESATDDLQIKLTVTRDEHPELFKALRAIQEPRRRTRRLKDLAAMGLLIERGAGLTVGPAPGPAIAEAVSGEVGPDLLGDALSVALWEEKAD